MALRKASLRLLPLLGLCYGAAYMDRANVSYAALQMNQQLHFSASIYGLGAGLFFLGYALCEIPSNLLLVRFGARRWLARIMITWGLLAIAMMLVRTPLQFYLLRFLLGVAEAGFFPGVIFYLTQWFPAEQRARSISRFYVALPLSSVCMGAVAGALLNLQGKLGLAGWQWLFLVEGLPAVLLGVVILFQLPDGPADASWLQPEERTWILNRFAQEQQLAASKAHGAHDGSWRALAREPGVGLMACLFLCVLFVAYSYNFSAPAILEQLTGLGHTGVGFLLAGTNLIAAAGMILAARHSDHTQERYLHVAIPFALIAICFLLSGLTTRPWVAVPALSMLIVLYVATLGVQWAIPPTFLSGRSAAVGIAAINSVGMLGGFLGPYWMGVAHDHTGSYQVGLLGCIVPSLIVIAIMLWMRRQAQARG